LNQYVILPAETGIGKEAAAAGITYLNDHLRNQVPEAVNSVSPGVARLYRLALDKTGARATHHTVAEELSRERTRFETR